MHLFTFYFTVLHNNISICSVGVHNYFQVFMKVNKQFKKKGQEIPGPSKIHVQCKQWKNLPLPEFFYKNINQTFF